MTRFFLPIYRKVCLGLFSLAFLASGALAQSPVSVIGPITPGNLAQFNSPTIIKDSGTSGGLIGAMPPFTVICNPTGSTAPAQDCTGIALATPVNTLNQALFTVQQVSGTTSVNCIASTSFQFPCANLFAITTDAVNASSPSNAFDGWQFAYTIGGSGASSIQGARQAVDAIVNFQNPTSVSNTNRNYVAGVFGANAFSGDGGTNTGAGAQGSFFGANAVVRATAGATNLRGLNGMEIDVVNSGGTTLSRFGLDIASWPTTQAANLTNDAAINIYGVSGTGAVSWHNGLEFSNLGGFAPVDSTGCLICTDGTSNTVAKGIDISPYTISTAAFKSTGFQIDGSGNLTANNVTSAWTAYTATITTGAGTITTQSSLSAFRQIGKTVFARIQVTVSNIGTGSGTVSVNLPVIPNGPTGMFCGGRESGVSGKILSATMSSGSAIMGILNYDNSAPTFSNGVVYNFSCTYEST